MKIKHLLLTAIMLVFCVNLYAQSPELEECNKAIELNPKSSDLYNERGMVYYNLGENLKALEDYNKAIELDSTNAEAYYNRGIIYKLLAKDRNLDKKKKAEYKALEEKDRKKYQELTKE